MCNLDQNFKDIRLNAERSLIKGRNHSDTPWSPKLAQAYLHVQLWLTLKISKEKQRDYSHRIQQLLNNIITNIVITHDLKTIKTKLQFARNHLDQIRKNAVELRIEYLWEQVVASEIEGNNKASTQIKQLIQIMIYIYICIYIY